jgi:integrase/recombinase XerC
MAWKTWKVGGVRCGYIDDGMYYISKTVHGHRYRVSTGCNEPTAAWEEFKRFLKAPDRYVPRSKSGCGFEGAVTEYIRWTRVIKGNGEDHVERVEKRLADFTAFRRDPNRVEERKLLAERTGPLVFTSLDTFTKADIETFVEDLRAGWVTGNKVGQPTVNRYLAALKGLMTWATEESKITTNEAANEVVMALEETNVRPPQAIETARWKAMAEQLDERWLKCQEVILGSGARYSEVARIREEDIRPHGIHFPKVKNRKARTVPVSDACVKAARRLLELGGVPDDEASQFDHRLEVAARRARVKKYTAHHLRHTYGTNALRKLKGDLKTLQELLGHKRITTTEKYLHALRAEDGLDVPVGVI